MKLGSLSAVFGALLILLAAPALSMEALFHPDLVQAEQRLLQARGPAVYTALRRIWGTWDRADPSHVEEVLLRAELSARLAPPVRAYAGLLAAYARSRRGDFKGARDKIAALGYVDRWLVIGPFDNDGKSGLEEEFGPELDVAKPLLPGRAYSGKERPVRWRAVPRVFPYGFLDTGALVRPERQVCVYATTFVSLLPNAKPLRSISLWVGVGGAFKLFWNGKLVLGDAAYRGHDADRYAETVSLEPGQNNLTVKACGEDSAPIVSVRLADAEGAPDARLVTSNDFAASEEVAKRLGPATSAAAAKPADAPKSADAETKAVHKPVPHRGVDGPLQALARRTTHARPSAAELFAHADYLAATEGDDKAQHTARDLARRAAEQDPSLERLLLVSQLAEDRNHAKDWLDKASRLAGPTQKSNELLLALAAHAQSGPNWRDAIPLYDEVLAADPDNVRALHGRAQAYNEAGLKRTALQLLERALERNSGSVNLLNMYASQLRALGRDSEAAQTEARYSYLRFDDRSFMSGRIDLAIARRDRASAERWVERLLEADPDGQWAFGVAARAYRRLKQPERASAAYRRALELAPEDVGTLRALADLHGELGQRDQELALLREILRLRPQDRAVREYVEQIEPARKRPDEAYAWDSKRFLQQRHAPAAGQNRRTLRDLTVTTVFQNGLSSRFRQVVFQPLTDSAAAALRQYAFQYEADREVVQLRGARVYRGDGKVDEAIEYGEAAADDPSIAMYTSAKNFYIELPRLEPGDVVELRYRVDDITPINEYAGYFGEVVYLQSSEPVFNAEYVLITPKARTLYIDQRVPGLTQTVQERPEQRIYRFFSPKVPEISPEPSMPAWPEVLGFVHVSTYKNWQDLGRWYWGMSKEQFDLDDETRKLARAIAKDARTELEKIRAVYDWVVKNTRYVALEFGIYGYKPRRCVQTVARGWGDCKDKATVIVTLLSELGIRSTIVIVRTQLRGDFPGNLPSLAPFDHAIVYVPSQDLYLDGTAEFTGSSELPKMDLGALGLLVNQGNSKLTRMPGPDPAKNVTARKLAAQLTQDGSAKLEINYETRGVAAADWRRRYHAEATQRDRITADLGSEFPGFALTAGAAGLTTSDLDNLELPVQMRVHGAAPTFARREGNQLILPATTNVRLTPTYASLSRRRQDVRILAFSSIDDTITLKLPPGMSVVSAPASVHNQSEFGFYSIDVDEQPGQLVVRSRLGIRASRVRPAQYAAWRKFCGDADRVMSVPLILGPTTPKD
jgi:cellulose synthase operon protein C